MSANARKAGVPALAAPTSRSDTTSAARSISAGRTRQPHEVGTEGLTSGEHTDRAVEIPRVAEHGAGRVGIAAAFGQPSLGDHRLLEPELGPPGRQVMLGRGDVLVGLVELAPADRDLGDERMAPQGDPPAVDTVDVAERRLGHGRSVVVLAEPHQPIRRHGVVGRDAPGEAVAFSRPIDPRRSRRARRRADRPRGRSARRRTTVGRRGRRRRAAGARARGSPPTARSAEAKSLRNSSSHASTLPPATCAPRSPSRRPSLTAISAAARAPG